MSYLYSPIPRVLVAAIILVSVPSPPRAVACSASFPNQMDGGVGTGDEALLQVPAGDFNREIKRLDLPACALVFTGGNSAADTAETDIADLRAALVAAGRSAADVTAIADPFAAVRVKMVEYAKACADWRERQGWRRWQRNAKPDPEPARPELVVPAGLPEEFSLYFRGALAWHAGQIDHARQFWLAVLSLPPGQRHYRSTWAVFMLGKISGDEPDRAKDFFKMTRRLASEGFADSLGLAAGSLGWEARLELDCGNVASAIGLYTMQFAGGDPTASMSLRRAADAALRSTPETLDILARDPIVRGVITAYIVAEGGPFQPAPTSERIRAWLDAVERSKTPVLRGADSLAWAAYQWGDYAMAGRWVVLAEEGSGMGRWIKAKLLLRQGKVAEGTAMLARAAERFSPDEQWFSHSPYEPAFVPADRIAGELGVLKLARGQYIQAMDLLLRHGHWLDAAYVAERVLRVEELLEYVRRSWPMSATEPAAAVANWYENDRMSAPQTRSRIRALLGRRLVRLGRFTEAAEFLPAETAAQLDVYVKAIRAGGDTTLTRDQRGLSLWKAAKIARNSGMELMGTELGPDAFFSGGAFENNWILESRRKAKWALTACGDDELARLGAWAEAGVPERRWHYRWIATAHAWDAAAMLPDESDFTAAVLCTAGSWIKVQDPRGADRFYKALVRRCGTTDLGRVANKRRWFPTCPEP